MRKSCPGDSDSALTPRGLFWLPLTPPPPLQLLKELTWIFISQTVENVHSLHNLYPLLPNPTPLSFRLPLPLGTAAPAINDGRHCW